MITGAIFDLDGTLIDSMAVWDTIGETYLRTLGYEPKEDINEVLRPLSLYQAACYCKSEYGIPMSAEELMAGVNKAVENAYFYSVPAKEGVNDFLSRLSKTGVKMCVATATDRYLVEAALRRLELDRYFSDIFTCTEAGCGKEEPAVYRRAHACLGTDKTKTVVFEDALHAAATARKDGFITVGVYDRYTEEQEELKRISDVYLPDYLHTEAFWDLAGKM